MQALGFRVNRSAQCRAEAQLEYAARDASRPGDLFNINSVADMLAEVVQREGDNFIVHRPTISGKPRYYFLRTDENFLGCQPRSGHDGKKFFGGEPANLLRVKLNTGKRDVREFDAG